MKSSNQNNKDKDAISNKSSNVVMIRSLEYKEYRRMSPMKNRNQNNKDKDTNWNRSSNIDYGKDQNFIENHESRRMSPIKSSEQNN